MTTPLPDFLASECEMREADALFHVLPAPMEQSVSYGAGTAHGPRAILEASQQLEAWDGFSCPLEEGIHSVMGLPRKLSSALKTLVLASSHLEKYRWCWAENTPSVLGL